MCGLHGFVNIFPTLNPGLLLHENLAYFGNGIQPGRQVMQEDPIHPSSEPVENPWQTLSSEIKYENPWIVVRENQVINPSGGRGIYGVVHFRNIAVGIVPVDDEMHTWLVGQYRYPHDCYEWEIPEGGASPPATPLENAKRELLEETGIVAGRWDMIQEMQLSNSTSNEVSQTFLARDLSFQEAEPEETEALVVERVPLQEACRRAMEGEIRDCMSVAALLKVRLLWDRGEL